MNSNISRRAILLHSLQLPLMGAGLVALQGCGPKAGSTSAAGGPAVCADLSALSDAEQGTRKSLNYVEASPNPNQVCAGCSFFHPGSTAGGCGTCDMFSGGPVNSHGHCNSWSAKG